MRDRGGPGVQATSFFLGPSGNALRIEAFRDKQLFAKEHKY